MPPVFLLPRRCSVCKQDEAKHIVLVCPAVASAAIWCTRTVNLARSLDLQPPDYYCYLLLFTRRCGHFERYHGRTYSFPPALWDLGLLLPFLPFLLVVLLGALPRRTRPLGGKK